MVLIDESGFFLNPLVLRTWAARGRTPVLTGFGRHRDKVSTIAAISVAPRRRRLGLSIGGLIRSITSTRPRWRPS